MVTRRDFLGSAGAAAALAAAPAPMKALGANDRIRIALVGCGDRGQEDLRNALKQPNIEVVAIADTYSRRRDQMKVKHPSIKI